MTPTGAASARARDAFRPTLFGRSSSHFTRVARIFAIELGVDTQLQVVGDLLSRDPEVYGGNPALKIPTLRTPRGTWFGALNVCRELARMSEGTLLTAFPEDLREPSSANAQELVLQAMATEVGLIMASLTGGGGSGSANVSQAKAKDSLTNSLLWLETNAAAALDAQPPRDLGFLEVTLFCLVTHLEFREVVSTEAYPFLRELSRRFGSRRSAHATVYRFDA